MKTITAQKIPKKSIFFKNNKLKLEKSPKNKSAMVFLGHHNWNMVKRILFKKKIIYPGFKHDDRNTNCCQELFHNPWRENNK